MSHSEEPSISIKVPKASAASRDQKAASRISRRGNRLQSGIAAALTIMLVLIGWFSWNYLHNSSKSVDDEAIADMEGFEPPSAQKPTEDESPRFRLDVPATDQPAASNEISLPELPPQLFGDTTSSSTGKVSLTGTIEDSDSPESVESPVRISDAPGRVFLR